MINHGFERYDGTYCSCPVEEAAARLRVLGDCGLPSVILRCIIAVGVAVIGLRGHFRMVFQFLWLGV